MNKNIMVSLLYLLLFMPLQYWQLTRLIKGGEVNEAGCCWIVANTFFIAYGAAKMAIGLEEADRDR
jgi:hypothetical protein